MRAAEENNHLTHEEIEAYLSGSLSGREENRIERHLLACELCSDAVEGLSQLDASERDADIKALKQQLPGSNHKRGISYWSYAAAAAVVVLISISIFSLVDTGPGHTDQIAEEKSAPADKDESASEDSQIAELKPEPAPEGSEESTEEPLPVPEKKRSDKFSEHKQAEVSNNRDVTVSSEEAQMAQEPTEEEEVVADMVEEVKESEKTSAMPATDDANIASNQLRKSAAADRLQETAPETAGEAATFDEEPPSQQARPKNGWDNFRNYIAQAFAYPPQAASEGITGTVKLEFDVMKDGSIENIEVLEGPESGCHEEAIRVLKEGPKWEPAQMNGNPLRSRRTLEIECR